MFVRWSLLCTLVAVTANCCFAQTAADFTPPGPNIALNKQYKLDPLPTYGDPADAADATQLTDGVHATTHFWVDKASVGWVHSRPVIVTVDLGQVEPVSGVSYSTAAGSADVAWPFGLLLMVSDDGERWTVAGDLIALSNKRGAPPPKPYRLHKFATGDLQTRGRYVAFVIDGAPYTVVDEVEVYRGQDAWLNQEPPGRKITMSPKEYQRTTQISGLVQYRLKTDLDEIAKGLDGSRLSAAEKSAWRARAAKVSEEIEEYSVVPDDFTTVLPLNELHARVYALQAPLLRARGYRGVTAWGGYRYDPLEPQQAPAQAPTRVPALSLRLMRNEHRAEVLNLTNPADAPLTATLTATGLGRYAAGLALREVIFTDTRDRTPIASAIGPKMPAEKGLKISLPAGTTRQIWLDFDSEGLPAGEARGAIKISADSGRQNLTVPLTVRVADFVMPARFSTAIGGWDETNNRGGYQVTAENMMPLIANLREHGVNMPWSNPQVMPTPGEYDAEGNMTAQPDFASWDEWVKRWEGASCWGLFPNVGSSFAGEPMGTPRFNKMVGAWITAWVEHAGKQGIKPGQIMLLLVDEARGKEHDQIIITWAKALHAAQPDIVVWNDPIHSDPASVDPEFYAQSDVLCPNSVIFLGKGKEYQDFFVAKQQAGSELWFYACSGPSKLLDPASYYRGQFWLNLKYGGKGSLYWAFADDAGNSWNAYVQPRTCYSPLFLTATTITDAKQMEAIREGAQDYEYFTMLRSRVEALERKGVANPLVAQAKALLVSGPEQAVAIMGPDKQPWPIEKDRTIMDKLRLQALDLLEKLAKLQAAG